MTRFTVYCLTFLSLALTATTAFSCKSGDKTAATTKVDSTSAPKSNIHVSGKVQTGTFVNGPAQDTSSTGSKPK